MLKLTYTRSLYQTKSKPLSWIARQFPSLTFYARFLRIIFQASALSKQGRYDNTAWCASSLGILRALESVGVQVEISGIDHLEQLNRPCVIISNHMSMLETVILPIIIQPIQDVTFVVKQDLLTYPVFKHVMQSRRPVAVTRSNPREDFKAVMTGGTERLHQGTSMIVFPQTTRTATFDPEQFNSIGVKLAQRANVPIVPLALKTDAWGNGKWLKDFGKIDVSKKVYFRFGQPIHLQGRSVNGHQIIVDFIREQLHNWTTETVT